MPKPRPYFGVYSLVLPFMKETWAGFAVVTLGLASFYVAHSVAWPSPTLANLLIHVVAVALEKSSTLTHVLSTGGLR